MQEYSRVPGAFREMLETLMVMNRSVEIIFRSKEGGRAVLRDRIRDMYEEGGRQWLRTAGGLEIGLDSLIQVDGRIPSKYC